MENKHSELNPFGNNWTTTICCQQQKYCSFSRKYHCRKITFALTPSNLIVNPRLEFPVFDGHKLQFTIATSDRLSLIAFHSIFKLEYTGKVTYKVAVHASINRTVSQVFGCVIA